MGEAHEPVVDEFASMDAAECIAAQPPASLDAITQSAHFSPESTTLKSDNKDRPRWMTDSPWEQTPNCREVDRQYDGLLGFGCSRPSQRFQQAELEVRHRISEDGKAVNEQLLFARQSQSSCLQ